MRQAVSTFLWVTTSFNPHPTRRPDATPDGAANAPTSASFNPHPTRRPDATLDHTGNYVGFQEVSILTRPEGRMRQGRWAQAWAPRLGFNPHPTRRPDATRGAVSPVVDLTWFQSSPDPKAGCDPILNPFPSRKLRFQSSPDPKAGCDLPILSLALLVLPVSILTRPEGRMRRNKPWRPERERPGFNPHPTRRPDATPIPRSAGRLPPNQFQSSPDPKAGCDVP